MSIPAVQNRISAVFERDELITNDQANLAVAQGATLQTAPHCKVAASAPILATPHRKIEASAHR